MSLFPYFATPLLDLDPSLRVHDVLRDFDRQVRAAALVTKSTPLKLYCHQICRMVVVDIIMRVRVHDCFYVF